MKKKLFTIMMPSEETPGDFHEVVFFNDETIECNCRGSGLYKKVCKHIKGAKSLLTKNWEKYLDKN